MLDSDVIRRDPEAIKLALARRGAHFPRLVDDYLDFDKRKRAVIQKLEGYKAEKNKLAKDVGPMFRQWLADNPSMTQLKDEIRQLDKEVAALEKQLRNAAAHGQ
ncbi:MAG: serine--tRNA ligase, partial [bacterium]|nr:serine--tRNA ligase [bacterium]